MDNKILTAMQQLGDELFQNNNPNARISNGDFLNSRGDGDDTNVIFLNRGDAPGASTEQTTQVFSERTSSGLREVVDRQISHDFGQSR